jgi:two-component system chemotaxis response regulator CheY
MSAKDRKRVLVADDELSQRRLIQFCLEQLGHQVITAPDGRAALELARSSDFDVIVLDVDMPYMNGFEVLTFLRTDARFNDTFVVMLTAQSSDEMVAQGYAEGANMYLTKPVDTAVLARVFRK